jgi:hypothetical protein
MSIRKIVSPHGAKPKRVAGAAGPQLVYNGGPLLANVEVTTIYWGSAWNSDPLMNQLEAFFNFVVASSLIDQLAEYSVPGFTVGRGKRGACAMVGSDPGATIDDSAIQTALQGWIASGLIPAPNANSVYFIFFPSGTTVTLQGQSSCVDFCGYHNNVGANADGGPFYAVIPYADCVGCAFAGTTLDSMTAIASHELCEAITDPVPGAGWYDNANGEIGDICEPQTKVISAASTVAKAAANPNVSVVVTVDGFNPLTLSGVLTPTGTTPPPPPPPPPPTGQSWTVQLEWSNAKNACV